jgi:hypothetical protein
VIVTDIKILGFDVFGTFRAGDITIFGKGESTHVVLINNISCDRISLRFKEMACPQNITRLIVEADKFALSGALGGYLLLGGGASSSTFPKSKKATSVALAIVVSLVRCINIPFNRGEGVRKEGKGKVSGTAKIFEASLEFAPVIFVR